MLPYFGSFALRHSFSVFLCCSASKEKCYKQIQAAIMKYREIKENINEGLKFYVTLQVSFFSLYSSKLFTVKACLDYATCPGWFFYSDFTLH